MQNDRTLALIASRTTPLSQYRPPVPRRHAPALPPKWEPRPRTTKPPPPLAEFVFLSILLHALAILLFGAPSGGSKEGRALWGSLDVVITRALPRAEPAVAPAPAPAPIAPRAPKEAPPVPAEVRPSPPAPAVDVPYAFPPLLDRLPSPERTVEMTPAPQVPPPTEAQVIAPPQAEAPPQPETAPQPEAPAAVVDMPALPSPLPPLAPHAPSPAMVEPPPVEAIAPPLPAPVERTPAEAVPIPAPLLLEPLPGLRPEAATQPMREAPEIEAPPASVTPRDALDAARVPAASERPASPAAVEPPSLFRTPAPSSRDDASAYDPTAPVLDPEALRRRAGQLAREGVGNRALLAFPMPPVPPRKSKLESAIENARKPDCKTAYQSLGLAAIVPLIANEFGEGTCRW